MKLAIVLTLLLANTFAFARSVNPNQKKPCSVEWKNHLTGRGCVWIPIYSKVSFPYQTLAASATLGTGGLAGLPLTFLQWSDWDIPQRPFIKMQVGGKVRAGYMPENEKVPFRGNILYLQGFADSMLNHRPLFEALTNEGYRVIAFDYMGQGGSEGTMNNVRVEDIVDHSDIVYYQLARQPQQARKIVIGYSVGGLAALLKSHDILVNDVVVLSPTLTPKYLVGEQHPFLLQFSMVTLKTLTSQPYTRDGRDPHVEPPYPRSQLDVKDFTLSMITTAKGFTKSSIAPRVRGLALFNDGSKDLYINVAPAIQTLKKIAPGFEIRQYQGVLHELDNERPAVALRVRQDIIHFLNAGN